MAFLRKNLYNIGGAAGNPPSRLWVYDTLDSLATVAGANYFATGASPNNAVNELQPFDIIITRVWTTAVGAIAGGTVTSSATLACGFVMILTVTTGQSPANTAVCVTKIATV